MAWIESHQSLRDHPKTRKLARILNVSVPTTIGHLHCLWWWAMDYSDDGDISRHDALDIAIGGGWDDDPGQFVDALVAVGFLDSDDDHTAIHDWPDYGGKLTSRRKANAERMRDARAKENKPRAAHVQRTQRTRAELHNSTQEDRTGQDKVSGADAPEPTDPEPAKTPPKNDPPPKPEPGKPMPRNGTAQTMLAVLYEDVLKIGTPTNYRQAVGQAQRFADAGATVDEVERIGYWLLADPWHADKGITITTVINNRDKWKSSQNAPRTTPNGSLSVVRHGQSGKVGRDGLTDEERGWREDPGHKGWSADEAMRMALAMEQRERERNSA